MEQKSKCKNCGRETNSEYCHNSHCEFQKKSVEGMEERFDKKFKISLGHSMQIDKFGHGKTKSRGYGFSFNEKKLKQFITQELSLARADERRRVGEKIDGRKIDMNNPENFSAAIVNGENSEVWVDGWNSALDSVLEIINKKQS